MDESTLLYQEGEPDGDGTSRQVVLQLPEGCDAAEGVIMQIEGDKIHIITQGGQLGSNPLGIAMESIMQVHQVAGDSQLCITDSGEVTTVDTEQQLQVTDAEDAEDENEVEEEADQPAEVEDGVDVEQLTAGQGQVEMEDVPEVVCFVCSVSCCRPARLLLTSTASSGGSLAERLASLLPLRLHCSAADGVCGGCRQLIEQADLHHTQLKAVQLQVRQLFRLEERLEEEEELQRQEQETARQRQETLASRQEQERRRQRDHDRELQRRQKRIQRRLRAGGGGQGGENTAEPFPFAADDDFDSSDEATTGESETTTSVPAAPPPPPLPPAEDLNDEDWTPRKRYCRRRRQPRRPWSPTDYGNSRLKEEAQGTKARDTAAATERTLSQTDQQQDGEVPTDAAAVTSQDQDQQAQAQDQEDQTPGGRDLDDVPTTTIEFVSFNGPQRRGRNKYRLMGLAGGSRSRQRAWTGTPNFYCRRCDTAFDCSNSLVEHITTTHTRPWCRRCRREFDTTTELGQHRRRCRSQCSLCGSRPANLVQHIRNKHPHSCAPDAAERRGGVETEAEAEEAVAEEGTVAGRSRAGPLRSTSTTAPAAPPTMIEFRDVSALREQVKNVKTPRFSLKLRRASTSDLERIQHLSVGDKRLTAGAGAGSSRPVTTRPHTCLRCGQHLGSLKEQIEHLHTVHKGKSWCRRCKSEFPNKQANLDHKSECKRMNSEGECPQCGKHVKNVKIHLRTHETPSKRKRESVLGPDGKLVSASLAGGECHICKKFIPHRLKRHIASHVQHPCPICKKLFSREDVIAGHIKRVHMKERPHICNHCGKGFVSLYSMQRHEMIHTNSYRFYCQECGDGFRQKQQLTTHMRHKHGVVEIEFEDVRESAILGEISDGTVTTELRFYCQECGDGFRDKQQLTTHMRHKHGVVEIEFEDVRESAILGEISDGTVTTELRFYCQECGSGFHSRRQLTAHMRNKHGVANVVFEDVQLHVAGTIEQLETVTVAEESAEADEAAAVDKLIEQGTDPTDSAAATDDRQDWWNPDQTTAY